MKIALINDTRPNSHYGCMLVMENLIRILEEKGVKIVWTWPVGKDWRKYKSELKKLPKIDAFILNGEGTIHHSARRKNAQYLGGFAVFSNEELGVPSYLINATLYKNDDIFYKNLKQFEMIYVRDQASLKELEAFGLKGDYVPDLTFGRVRQTNILPTKKGCVIDSTLKTDLPILKKYSKDHLFDYRSMVVARPSNKNFFRSPRPFIKNLVQWLMGDYKVSLAPQTFVDYLKKYEFVVTGRYHAVTMCIKNKIPFVAMESNTPKVSFLLNDVFGEDSRLVSIHNLSELNKEPYLEFSKEESQQLDRFVVFAEDKIDSMLEKILNDVRSKKINGL